MSHPAMAEATLPVGSTSMPSVRAHLFGERLPVLGAGTVDLDRLDGEHVGQQAEVSARLPRRCR